MTTKEQAMSETNEAKASGYRMTVAGDVVDGLKALGWVSPEEAEKNGAAYEAVHDSLRAEIEKLRATAATDCAVGLEQAEEIASLRAEVQRMKRECERVMGETARVDAAWEVECDKAFARGIEDAAKRVEDCGFLDAGPSARAIRALLPAPASPAKEPYEEAEEGVVTFDLDFAAKKADRQEYARVKDDPVKLAAWLAKDPSAPSAPSEPKPAPEAKASEPCGGLHCGTSPAGLPYHVVEGGENCTHIRPPPTPKAQETVETIRDGEKVAGYYLPASTVEQIREALEQAFDPDSNDRHLCESIRAALALLPPKAG